ncbi:hypothetical protein J3R83DRAFT_1917 [Lanmaoa asiatica]|nr:hypothetical protein J3R83DRAFT_1917 [Lanmaoa asiatica]
MDPGLKTKLDTLKHYLSNLPDTLPLPEAGLTTYNFGLFDISAEEIEDYGENRQDLETLQDHIKIRQWHHAGPGAKNENIEHKPKLKWWEVESTLGKRANSQVIDKSLPPAGRAAPRPHLKSLDGELGGGAYAGKATPWRVADAEIEDGNDWLDEPHWLDPAAVGVERHTFTLGGRNDIDLSSSYLHSILSDTDIF